MDSIPVKWVCQFHDFASNLASTSTIFPGTMSNYLIIILQQVALVFLKNWMDGIRKPAYKQPDCRYSHNFRKWPAPPIAKWWSNRFCSNLIFYHPIMRIFRPENTLSKCNLQFSSLTVICDQLLFWGFIHSKIQMDENTAPRESHVCSFFSCLVCFL